MSFIASAIIPPQSYSGGCTPMPRKERAAIIMRLAPMVTTVSVTIGSATLGTM
ncbi:hypothetical protein D3C81_2248570 [compost metagenome]